MGIMLEMIHKLILVLTLYIQFSFEASVQLNAVAATVPCAPNSNSNSCIFPASGGNNLTDTSGVAGTLFAASAPSLGTKKTCPPEYPCFRLRKPKCCSVSTKGRCNYRDCKSFF